jgi:hypothetical protein
MLTPRRRKPAVLAGFAIATLLVACGDLATGPKSVVRGPRSLADSGSIEWADTLGCRYGWQIINGFVECLPPQ